MFSQQVPGVSQSETNQIRPPTQEELEQLGLQDDFSTDQPSTELPPRRNGVEANLRILEIKNTMLQVENKRMFYFVENEDYETVYRITTIDLPDDNYGRCAHPSRVFVKKYPYHHTIDVSNTEELDILDVYDYYKAFDWEHCSCQ
jgi:hypothetical protein